MNKFVADESDIDALIKEHEITINQVSAGDILSPTVEVTCTSDSVGYNLLPTVQVAEEPDTLDKDFKDAQETLKSASDILLNTIDRMAEFAEASQHPGAYEILGDLVSKLAGIQKNVIELHEKKARIRKDQNKEDSAVKSSEPTTVTNNTMIFAGTATQLDEMIKKQLSNGNKK